MLLLGLGRRRRRGERGKGCWYVGRASWLLLHSRLSLTLPLQRVLFGHNKRRKKEKRTVWPGPGWPFFSLLALQLASSLCVTEMDVFIAMKLAEGQSIRFFLLLLLFSCRLFPTAEQENRSSVCCSSCPTTTNQIDRENIIIIIIIKSPWDVLDII